MSCWRKIEIKTNVWYIKSVLGVSMKINELKGVGVTLEKKLNNLDIYSVYDLLEYYPYRYNVVNIIDINNAEDNENCMVKAIIVDQGKVQ